LSTTRLGSDGESALDRSAKLASGAMSCRIKSKRKRIVLLVEMELSRNGKSNDRRKVTDVRRMPLLDVCEQAKFTCSMFFSRYRWTVWRKACASFSSNLVTD
jgi:hypothetical protein